MSSANRRLPIGLPPVELDASLIINPESSWKFSMLDLIKQNARNEVPRRRRNFDLPSWNLELLMIPSVKPGVGRNGSLHASPTARNCVLCLPGSFTFIFPIFLKKKLSCILYCEPDFTDDLVACVSPLSL